MGGTLTIGLGGMIASGDTGMVSLSRKGTPSTHLLRPVNQEATKGVTLPVGVTEPSDQWRQVGPGPEPRTSVPHGKS